MADQSIVRLHAFATVDSEDWEAFTQMVAETKIIVQSEGAENVLTHECYYEPDGFNCLIVEAYANEKAFLNHLELITPLSEKYKVNWKINRIELCGPFSEQTVNALKQGVSEGQCVHYSNALGS
jgi:hypothetical protein